MGQPLLSYDPYNLIITGVGGQGNVLSSRMVGDMLSQLGFFVTIGETFGASQRGGSVMSHVRVSAESCFSPQIPRGRAHMIMALEPIEAIRVLRDYGNPGVNVLCNTRPIHPVGVISGEQAYPSLEDIRKWIGQLADTTWFIDATEGALKLGNPVFGNIVLVGALAATGVLPLDVDTFKEVLQRNVPPDKITVNVTAYSLGATMVRS
jgi:indolepyruvate ferredoxin oxidoreductase beta subunit